MNKNETRSAHLQELGGSKYEMADGQVNIKGWDVKDAAGRKLGDVDELIFDDQALKVRYIVLDLDDNDMDLEDRKVLVPIGMAVLHEKDDDVILGNVSAEQLISLPAYEEDNLGSNMEQQVCQVFGRDTNMTETDYYDHAYFDDDVLYRNRQQLR